MRKTIGNITGFRLKQIDPDPAREAVRQAVIAEHRIKRAQMEIDGYLNELRGDREDADAILKLFDADGNPPPFSYAAIVEQYERLRAQQLWLAALHEELEGMLKKLDPNRYAAEEAERDARRTDLQDRKNAVRNALHIDEKERRRPWLHRILHEALQTLRNSYEFDLVTGRARTDIHISTQHHIESAMNNLFVPSARRPALPDPETRYAVLRRESDWLAATAIDMNGILLRLNELIDSGDIYSKSA